MPRIGMPTNRRGSKKSTSVNVGVLNGKPALQVNWGGRIYGTQLSLIGSGSVKDDLDVKDIRATGNITFSKNSSVYNNSNRVIMSGGMTVAGDGNMAIGKDTNLSSLVGDANNIENIAIGTSTLQQAVNGKYNIAIGISAMYNIGKNSSETYDDVTGNIAIGGGALQGRGTRPQGSHNVAIGHGSMLNVDTHDGGYGLTAKQNVCLGYTSGQNLEGENNIYLGYRAGLGTPFYQVGNDNVGIGADSLYSVKDADDNICIGSASGGLIEDGDRNICIGTNAGNAIVDGTNNICIGYDADVNASGAVNRVLISPVAATVDADSTTLLANTEIILDAEGDITLDADGDNITMKAGSTGSGLDFIQSGTGDYTIKNLTSDKDIIFNVNDGGSDEEVFRVLGATQALRTHQSNKIEFGGASEHIYGDGNDLHIKAETGVDFGATTCGFTAGAGTDAVSINWQQGNKYHLLMENNSTVTFATNPNTACNLLLKVTQGNGGSKIITWAVTSGDIYWAGGGKTDTDKPTLTTTDDDSDILTFYWDGTNYFGVASLNFDTAS